MLKLLSLMFSHLPLLIKQIHQEVKSIALSNISIYYTLNIESSYNSNKFKILAPTWNGKTKLPDGLNSVSDIQDYFEYTLKNVKKRLIIFR